MLSRLFLLALALTVKICAAPNPPQTHFRGESVTTAKGSCGACISALEVGKRSSWVSPNIFIRELIMACQRSGQTTPDVCEGLFKEQGPVLAEVIKHMDVTHFDGYLFCASVLGACDYPAIRPFHLEFAKPKPANATLTRPPSGRNFTVVHLSDWHFDPEYTPGSEAACDKPLCCRSDSRSSSTADPPPTNITRPANPWGDYACDAPLSLHESLLSFLANNLTTLPSFAILTGDIPPHNIWQTLPISATHRTEQIAYNLLRRYFGPPDESLLGVPLYPTIGNHEVAPANLYPPHGMENPKLPGGDASWLYNSLAKSWKPWLGGRAANQVMRNGGSYAVKVADKLRLVSLNTNFCYVNNWWLFKDTNDTVGFTPKIPHRSCLVNYPTSITKQDPNNILAWLIHQLQLAEDAGDRVWIIGHHPPGVPDCFHEYSARFSKIVERYAPHVIAGNFMGHTHKDEFEIFYQDGIQDADHAISVAYIAPSVTPYRWTNPGFRYLCFQLVVWISTIVYRCR
ncbi:Metallo-dependent phosphatase-like protein [Jimgerdemannia flammicorona]|uniref:Metallo-dependent phosphatase-like protein n=1 Tax=Jimgerdemannia flammicorona TaxID=994334 RepID=A0A433D9U6_9FUNG|nr:Metallo-dependent phosphatase-like protein [Jimgerdemannia flammicorona]